MSIYYHPPSPKASTSSTDQHRQTHHPLMASPLKRSRYFQEQCRTSPSSARYKDHTSPFIIEKWRPNDDVDEPDMTDISSSTDGVRNVRHYDVKNKTSQALPTNNAEQTSRGITSFLRRFVPFQNMSVNSTSPTVDPQPDFSKLHKIRKRSFASHPGSPLFTPPKESCNKRRKVDAASESPQKGSPQGLTPRSSIPLKSLEELVVLSPLTRPPIRRSPKKESGGRRSMNNPFVSSYSSSRRNMHKSATFEETNIMDKETIHKDDGMDQDSMAVKIDEGENVTECRSGRNNIKVKYEDIPCAFSPTTTTANTSLAAYEDLTKAMREQTSQTKTFSPRKMVNKEDLKTHYELQAQRLAGFFDLPTSSANHSPIVETGIPSISSTSPTIDITKTPLPPYTDSKSPTDLGISLKILQNNNNPLQTAEIDENTGANKPSLLSAPTMPVSALFSSNITPTASSTGPNNSATNVIISTPLTSHFVQPTISTSKEAFHALYNHPTLSTTTTTSILSTPQLSTNVIATNMPHVSPSSTHLTSFITDMKTSPNFANFNSKNVSSVMEVKDPRHVNILPGTFNPPTGAYANSVIPGTTSTAATPSNNHSISPSPGNVFGNIPTVPGPSMFSHDVSINKLPMQFGAVPSPMPATITNPRFPAAAPSAPQTNPTNPTFGNPEFPMFGNRQTAPAQGGIFKFGQTVPSPSPFTLNVPHQNQQQLPVPQQSVSVPQLGAGGAASMFSIGSGSTGPRARLAGTGRSTASTYRRRGRR